MSQYVFKMPDLGEGTVDAEIVAWHTKPGDVVNEDQLIVEVMTDKAAVEVPAPVSGRVVSITGAPGDKVAVGSPLIVFEVGNGAAAPASSVAPAQATSPAPATAPSAAAPSATAIGDRRHPRLRTNGTARASGRVMASPANRRRAREAGIDLSTVVGTRVPAGAFCATIWRPPSPMPDLSRRAPARPWLPRDPLQRHPKSRSSDCAGSSPSA